MVNVHVYFMTDSLQPSCVFIQLGSEFKCKNSAGPILRGKSLAVSIDRVVTTHVCMLYMTQTPVDSCVTLLSSKTGNWEAAHFLISSSISLMIIKIHVLSVDLQTSALVFILTIKTCHAVEERNLFFF